MRARSSSKKFGDVVGKIGEVAEVGETSIKVTTQGGQVEIFKLKHEDGKKMSAGEFAQAGGVAVGTILGS